MDGGEKLHTLRALVSIEVGVIVAGWSPDADGRRRRHRGIETRCPHNLIHVWCLVVLKAPNLPRTGMKRTGSKEETVFAVQHNTSDLLNFNQREAVC